MREFDIQHVSMAKRIEIWPLDRVLPYARNARTHSTDQIDQLASSIVKFGFTNPILVDSNDGIIAGHGRFEAAKRLNLEQVPVVILDHLSDAQRRAYIIADNRLAENAGWDYDKLAQEFKELTEDNFDIEVIGFSEKELNEFLDIPVSFGPVDEDEVPRLDKKKPHVCPKCGHQF